MYRRERNETQRDKRETLPSTLSWNTTTNNSNNKCIDTRKYYEGIIDWYSTNKYRWKKQAKIEKKRKEQEQHNRSMVMMMDEGDTERQQKYQGMKYAIEQTRANYEEQEQKRRIRIERAIQNTERERYEAIQEMMAEEMMDEQYHDQQHQQHYQHYYYQPEEGIIEEKEGIVRMENDEMEGAYYKEQPSHRHEDQKNKKKRGENQYKQYGIKCQTSQKQAIIEERIAKQQQQQQLEEEREIVEHILRGSRKRQHESYRMTRGRHFGGPSPQYLQHAVHEEGYIHCCQQQQLEQLQQQQEQHHQQEVGVEEEGIHPRKKLCVSYSGVCALCGTLKTNMSMVYPCCHMACEACLRHHVDYVSNHCPLCMIEENNEMRIKCILYERNTKDGSFAKVHWVKQPGKRYVS